MNSIKINELNQIFTCFLGLDYRPSVSKFVAIGADDEVLDVLGNDYLDREVVTDGDDDENEPTNYLVGIAHLDFIKNDRLSAVLKSRTIAHPLFKEYLVVSGADGVTEDRVQACKLVTGFIEWLEYKDCGSYFDHDFDVTLVDISESCRRLVGVDLPVDWVVMRGIEKHMFLRPFADSRDLDVSGFWWRLLSNVTKLAEPVYLFLGEESIRPTEDELWLWRMLRDNANLDFELVEYTCGTDVSRVVADGGRYGDSIVLTASEFEEVKEEMISKGCEESVYTI